MLSLPSVPVYLPRYYFIGGGTERFQNAHARMAYRTGFERL